MNLRPVKKSTDMDKMEPRLADLLHQVDTDFKKAVPAEYVPPKNRTSQLGTLTVKAVDSFAELPTGELDRLIMGVEAKIAAIKAEAESIKADYMARTTELRAAVDRLNQACVQGESKMHELHAQLNEIYSGKKALPAPEESTETPPPTEPAA